MAPYLPHFYPENSRSGAPELAERGIHAISNLIVGVLSCPPASPRRLVLERALDELASRLRFRAYSPVFSRIRSSVNIQRSRRRGTRYVSLSGGLARALGRIWGMPTRKKRLIRESSRRSLPVFIPRDETCHCRALSRTRVRKRR
jgi:hypothetical protein